MRFLCQQHLLGMCIFVYVVSLSAIAANEEAGTDFLVNNRFWVTRIKSANNVSEVLSLAKRNGFRFHKKVSVKLRWMTMSTRNSDVNSSNIVRSNSICPLMNSQVPLFVVTRNEVSLITETICRYEKELVKLLCNRELFVRGYLDEPVQVSINHSHLSNNVSPLPVRVWNWLNGASIWQIQFDFINKDNRSAQHSKQIMRETNFLTPTSRTENF